jgi:GNAT superfamily N-acetyltransferase
VNGDEIGTFDGRRGWLNRLATSPDRRGKGIATALVRDLERRLLAKGCVKINLLVEPAPPRRAACQLTS